MLRPGYLVVVLIGVLWLSLGASLVGHYSVVPAAHAVVIDKITLSGCVIATAPCKVAGWNGTTTMPNPTITVHQGDNVSLILTTNDTSAHQFQFDADKDTTSDTADCPAIDPCSSVIPTGGTVKYSFIENAAPSATPYTYFCIFHPGQMNGAFIVLSTTVGATTPPPRGSNPIVSSISLVSILLLTLLAAAALYAGRLRIEQPKK